MNTLLGALVSDRGGVSSRAGLTKKSVAAQHKARMKKHMEASKLVYYHLHRIYKEILPSFLDGHKGVASAPGNL